MSRTCFRNKQPFWYALYAGVAVDYDDDGYEIDPHTTYGKPVKTSANISPAKGNVISRQFGDDDVYDKIIVTGDRDTPIDEYTVLWIDREPDLDANGATIFYSNARNARIEVKFTATLDNRTAHIGNNSR